MRFVSPVLVVSDMERSVAFYKDILGLRVVEDFGANKVLDCGIALQTLESYKDFIDGASIKLGGNDSELYFEEDDIDAFARRLEGHDISYIHPVKEHSWGQRVVRFYDPDRHIIEVGEQMESVVSRFIEGGMTPQQIAERMDVSLEYVEGMI